MHDAFTTVYCHMSLMCKHFSAGRSLRRLSMWHMSGACAVTLARQPNYGVCSATSPLIPAPTFPTMTGITWMSRCAVSCWSRDRINSLVVNFVVACRRCLAGLALPPRHPPLLQHLHAAALPPLAAHQHHSLSTPCNAAVYLASR